MTADLLSLCCNLLDAACAPADAPPARATRRERRRGEAEAVSGPLWDIGLPGTKQLIPFIHDFARLQQARVSLNDRTLFTAKLTGGITAENDGLYVPHLRAWFGGKEEIAETFLPYSHPKAKPLCCGEWTPFGVATIRIGCSLLPTLTMDGDTVVVRWEDTPSVRLKKTGPLGLIDWNIEAGVKEIRIGEFTGRVVFTRPLVSLLAPDVRWE